MPASDKAMNELQNKWYNFVVTTLGLDANTFQLFQGQRPLGATSDELWTVFDAVPPLSLTQTQVVSGHNSFFSNYESIALTILPQGGDQFEQVMGDDLKAWEAYKGSLKPGDLPKGGILKAFKDWGELNLSPAVAGKAYGIFKQLQNGIVPRAVNAVLDDDNLMDGGPTYRPTIAELKSAVKQGRPFNGKFDSSTSSSDVEHTWAKTELGGAYRFFSGSAGGTFDSLSEKAEKAEVFVDATFKNVATASIAPGPWYKLNALNLAYKNSDNTVWPAGQSPSWDDLFSKEGSLQRVAAEVVAFDGLDLEMTSTATYSESEQETITAKAGISFWPFFSASGEGGSSSKVTFDDSGRMSVSSSVPKGNPALLGVNVLPIDQVLSLGAASEPLLQQSILAHQMRAQAHRAR